MSGIDLSPVDYDHLGDLKRKGTIPIAPDGEGVPVSVAIRLQLAGLARITGADPQKVTINRGRVAQHRSYP